MRPLTTIWSIRFCSCSTGVELLCRQKWDKLRKCAAWTLLCQSMSHTAEVKEKSTGDPGKGVMHALTSHALPKVSTGSTWTSRWAKDTQTVRKPVTTLLDVHKDVEDTWQNFHPWKSINVDFLKCVGTDQKKLLKVKNSFFFSSSSFLFHSCRIFFPRLIALSHMVQHEMKVLSYMFKVALSISLLSFISDSQSLLIGESFLCCKMEYFFVSTPTISKSNNVLKHISY